MNATMRLTDHKPEQKNGCRCEGALQLFVPCHVRRALHVGLPGALLYAAKGRQGIGCLRKPEEAGQLRRFLFQGSQPRTGVPLRLHHLISLTVLRCCHCYISAVLRVLGQAVGGLQGVTDSKALPQGAERRQAAGEVCQVCQAKPLGNMSLGREGQAYVSLL